MSTHRVQNLAGDGFMRLIGVALIGVFLCACGGKEEPSEYSIGGIVAGLSGGSLTLKLGSAVVPIAVNGEFVFPQDLETGAQYAVEVDAQPSGPSQTCIVSNGKGTVSNKDITNIVVNCTVNRFSVSGKVFGLAGSGLVLTNGLGGEANVASDGTFTFPQVASGAAFSISVRSPPVNPVQACSVESGSGVIGDQNVSGLVVRCDFRGVVKYVFDTDGGDTELAVMTMADGARLALNGGVDMTGNYMMSHQTLEVPPMQGSESEPMRVETTLNAEGLPTLIAAPEGSRLRLNWDTPGSLSFTYVSSDGTKQAISTISLPQNGALVGGKASFMQSLAKVRTRRARSARPLNLEKVFRRSIADSMPQLEPPTMFALGDSKTVSVTVKRCGVGVSDASVFIRHRPNNLNQVFYSQSYAKHVGEGVYQATFSMGKLPSIGSICRNIADASTFACDATTTTRGTEAGVCTQIAAAIDLALGGPTGEGVGIAAACTAALTSYNAFCLVNDGPVEGSQGISAKDFVCGSIAELENVLPPVESTPTRYYAEVSVEGSSPRKSAEVIVPLRDSVNLSVDFGGTPSITSFLTNPTNPSPFETYLATGSSSCTTGWSSSIRVSGTDGYEDSVTVVNSSLESSVSLAVPGGEAGVSDSLTLSVIPPSTGASLTRSIGITF